MVIWIMKNASVPPAVNLTVCIQCKILCVEVKMLQRYSIRDSCLSLQSLLLERERERENVTIMYSFVKSATLINNN